MARLDNLLSGNGFFDDVELEEMFQLLTAGQERPFAEIRCGIATAELPRAIGAVRKFYGVSLEILKVEPATGVADIRIPAVSVL